MSSPLQNGSDDAKSKTCILIEMPTELPRDMGQNEDRLLRLHPCCERNAPVNARCERNNARHDSTIGSVQTKP